MDNKPIIAISTNFLNITDGPFAGHKRIYVNNSYIDAILEAGGIPFLFPNKADLNSIQTLTKMADGVLMSGGLDVHPSYYNEECHPLLEETSRELDEQDLHIIHSAAKEQKPILGICRGLQLINVAFGGTLYQDLSLFDPQSKPQHRKVLAHPVNITPKSKLHGILGTESLSTNSYHHQSVKSLANEFNISGISSDGIVEGIESKKGWIIGVQWHAETMVPQQPEMKRLFKAFVEEAHHSRSHR